MIDLTLIVGMWIVLDLIGKAIDAEAPVYQGMCLVGVLVVLVVVMFSVGAVASRGLRC